MGCCCCCCCCSLLFRDSTLVVAFPGGLISVFPYPSVLWISPQHRLHFLHYSFTVIFPPPLLPSYLPPAPPYPSAALAQTLRSFSQFRRATGVIRLIARQSLPWVFRIGRWLPSVRDKRPRAPRSILIVQLSHPRHGGSGCNGGPFDRHATASESSARPFFEHPSISFSQCALEHSALRTPRFIDRRKTRSAHCSARADESSPSSRPARGTYFPPNRGGIQRPRGIHSQDCAGREEIWYLQDYSSRELAANICYRYRGMAVASLPVLDVIAAGNFIPCKSFCFHSELT